MRWAIDKFELCPETMVLLCPLKLLHIYMTFSSSPPTQIEQIPFKIGIIFLITRPEAIFS